MREICAFFSERARCGTCRLMQYGILRKKVVSAVYQREHMTLGGRLCTVLCPETKAPLPVFYICSGQALPNQWETVLADIRREVLVCHVTADWERTSRRGPRRDCRDARRLPARPKRICGFSPKRCARASFRLSCPPRGGVSYGGGIFAGRPVCALGAFSNGRIRRGGLALRFSLVRRLDGILRDARAAAGHARLSRWDVRRSARAIRVWRRWGRIRAGPMHTS